MKSKPIVMTDFYTVHTSFIVDFHFTNNLTVLTGDSGQGKSAVFSFIRESMIVDPRIECINYLDVHRNIDEMIRKFNSKLIVIDNADILLGDEIRKYIAFDGTNQYLIIGRNAANLMATEDNFFELRNEAQNGKTRFSLKPYL